MRFLFVLAFALLFESSSFAFESLRPNWGQTGHRTIGMIAENHLSKKARKNIEKLLDGQSLALVSTYGDDIKSDDRYDKYYTWHFVNFPLDGRYEESDKEEKGDIVSGIEHCIKVLENENSSEQDKVFHLKFLVHLIGDLHQPLHIGRAEDRGGNDIKVSWHYKNSNLHRVWDTDMVESWNMSYTELYRNAKSISKEQVRALEKGTVIDWMYESRELAKIVYGSASNEDKLGYQYSYKYLETALGQLQKGGIRLAKVLNDIYG